jgi:thiamine-monophosphate kinase
VERNGTEREAVALLSMALPRPPAGETWLGDDAAVLSGQGDASLLLATDSLVAGVHFDLRWSSLADVGWKALTANVSDIAAMGGEPVAAVVAVAGATVADLEHLYSGLVDAAATYRCPVVGGDLSAASELVVSIAVLGSMRAAGPVLRSGARAGDSLLVTGVLGRAAAGMRSLREDPRRCGELETAHRRPVARLAHGRAAALSGASAMIDVSDGLAIDLDRLALASGVGVELTEVPVAAGATLGDALGGGEDYELVFAARDVKRVKEHFAAAHLPLPLEIGTCTADASSRLLFGAEMPVSGYEHLLG